MELSARHSCLSEPLELVAVDLGGTHARFALARVAAGHVLEIGRHKIYHTAEFSGFPEVWAAYRQACGGQLPDAASIAVACPVQGERLQLTNLGWVLTRSLLPQQLGVRHVCILNDFAAQAHAVAGLPDDAFVTIGHARQSSAREGLTTIVGPGTGLGVSHVLRLGDAYHVLESEGGHVGFAPVDALEERMLARYQAEFGRVSAERLISGNGLPNIHAHLLAEAGLPASASDARTLWTEGLDQKNPMARQAIERFCAMLGSFAGDCVMMSGASSVVIAGGLGKRLGSRLESSEFMARFLAKGRLSAALAAVRVQRLTYDEPGLYGAALAFVRQS